MTHIWKCRKCGRKTSSDKCPDCWMKEERKRDEKERFKEKRMREKRNL